MLKRMLISLLRTCHKTFHAKFQILDIPKVVQFDQLMPKMGLDVIFSPGRTDGNFCYQSWPE